MQIEYDEAQDQRGERTGFHVRVPFLQQSVGLGDVIAQGTQAVGVQPCGGCQKRKEILNGRVQFDPWRT